MLRGSAADGTNSVPYSSGGAVDAVSPVTGCEVKSVVVWGCEFVSRVFGVFFFFGKKRAVWL